MRIKTLVENVSKYDNLKCAHGLSLYIETNNHKILFDMGPKDLFRENAEKLNVDLSEVDLAVISHGHYDHGGGLSTFLNINNKAIVYLNHRAFGEYYSNRKNSKKLYIGLDESLQDNNRLLFVGDNHTIDETLELISGIKGTTLNPSGNKDLFKKEGDSFTLDIFEHEQNLVIRDDKNIVLLAGCAHNGIANILNHFYNKNGYWPSHVIGGFHLYNRSTDTNEDPNMVEELGKFLLTTGAKFYTCHCTGIESYNLLKTIMSDKIDYISTGSQLSID